MLKNFWAIIIGSVIISIGIVIAGNMVADRITGFPGNFNVNTYDGRPTDTFLSESEAAAFLKLSNTDFQKLMQTGALDTAFTTIQGQRVYSERELAHYVGRQIGSGVTKNK